MKPDLESLKLIEEEIYLKKPKPLAKSKHGNLAAMSDYDKKYSEWREKYKKAIKDTENAE